MLALNRVNPRNGQPYTLVEVFSDTPQTEVRTGGKKMIMNHSIHLFNQGWYHWMNGELVQRAFPFLSNAEREFLITGLTPEEWDELMREEER
jgi:hypothetical protein